MSWFVAISEPFRQRQAVDLLCEMSFPAYAPTCLQTIVRNGRKVEVSRPLFGSYFFVAMREGWERIIGLRWVSKVLLSPRLQPLLITDGAVEEIRSREIGGAIHVTEGLREGMRVTPRTGHLVGVEGKFHRAYPQRDVALFNILGEETPVDFAPGVLEVLEPITVVAKRRRRIRR